MGSRGWHRAATLAAVCVALAGCNASTAAVPPVTPSTDTVATLTAPSVAGAAPAAPLSTATVPRALKARGRPAITKVLVIVEENHSLTQMRLGMPYLYGVARRYGYATDYRAATHPSLPNYLAISGGSTLGVTDDEPPSAHHLHGPSVFGQAISKGKTARLYAESLPAPCATSNTGVFAVRHTPWAYFADERVSCLRGSVAAGTPTAGRLSGDIRAGALPTVGMLVPDLRHDAHDGTLAEADQWLEGWLPRLLAGPDYRAGRLAIVVTADEDDYTSVNRVLTVVIAPGVTHRVVATPLRHYSVTRLYAEVDGARPLRQATTAPSLAKAFGLLTPP